MPVIPTAANCSNRSPTPRTPRCRRSPSSPTKRSARSANGSQAACCRARAARPSPPTNRPWISPSKARRSANPRDHPRCPAPCPLSPSCAPRTARRSARSPAVRGLPSSRSPVRAKSCSTTQAIWNFSACSRFRKARCAISSSAVTANSSSRAAVAEDTRASWPCGTSQRASASSP